MQVHLPQEQHSRLTIGMSRVDGKSGIGIGYAYMLKDENRAALTIAVGQSGSETTVQGGFGFEFGGSRKMSLPEPVAAEPEPAPEPIGQVVLTEEEYETLLMAQVQQEELDEQRELAETRYAQQQSLIDELRDELRDERQGNAQNEEDIERLKQKVEDEVSEAERRHFAAIEKLKGKKGE
jgi:hypothetical protein